MYNILGKKCEIKEGVTPKSLIVLVELGLLNSGKALSQEDYDYLEKTFEDVAFERHTNEDIRECRRILSEKPPVNEVEILIDKEKLLRLIDAVFDIDITADMRDNWLNIDTEAVIEGAYQYMGKLSPSSLRQMSYLKNLQSSISAMTD